MEQHEVNVNANVHLENVIRVEGLEVPRTTNDNVIDPPDTDPFFKLVASIGPQLVDDFFATKIDDALTVAIVGESGSGKTALAYEMFDQYQGSKQLCVYNHPNPPLIHSIRTKNGKQILNVTDFNHIIWMHDLILWIDEPQIYFPRIENLVKFLSIARHKNITVLFTSNETRWFQARIEAYIQTWIIKDMDPEMAKRGSKIIKIIKRFQCFDGDVQKFHLDKTQFLIDSRSFAEFNGLFRNTIPDWFCEALSKPFASNNPKFRTIDDERDEDDNYVIWDDDAKAR